MKLSDFGLSSKDMDMDKDVTKDMDMDMDVDRCHWIKWTINFSMGNGDCAQVCTPLKKTEVKLNQKITSSVYSYDSHFTLLENVENEY